MSQTKSGIKKEKKKKSGGPQKQAGSKKKTKKRQKKDKKKFYSHIWQVTISTTSITGMRAVSLTSFDASFSCLSGWQQSALLSTYYVELPVNAKGAFWPKRLHITGKLPAHTSDNQGRRTPNRASLKKKSRLAELTLKLWFDRKFIHSSHILQSSPRSTVTLLTALIQAIAILGNDLNF